MYGSVNVPGGSTQGADGKSAYQIAVENGFSGTEAQWLASLKGDKGNTGETGAAGATGADGKSAYQIAVERGFTGAEDEWLASLKGESRVSDYVVAGQKAETTLGEKATAEGCDVISSGNSSHAEGCETIVTSKYAHVEGFGALCDSQYGGHAEGCGTMAVNGQAYIPIKSSSGSVLTAKDGVVSYLSSAFAKMKSGMDIYIWNERYSNGQIYQYKIVAVDAANMTITLNQDLPVSNFTVNRAVIPELKDSNSAYPNHAEGCRSNAIGWNSHAEGSKTVASHYQSHAEGDQTVSSGNSAHAEGSGTTASGGASHAEGDRTAASGKYSHAEGSRTTASADNAHAEGSGTTASADNAHAEGQSTEAIGRGAHAEGKFAVASGEYSHAGGLCTTAAAIYQTVIGRSNIASQDERDRLIVGNGGTSDSNCFRVNDAGVYANGNYNSTGADYAEQFEWKDSNPDNEDRIGRFVTLDGDKIRPALSSDDFILGIISGNPSVIGDTYDDQWQGMYKTDIFGRWTYEDVTVPAEYDGEGNMISEEHVETRLAINPNYNSNEKYIPRFERKEWAVVGMMGKLVLIDDGTCEVNGWAKPSDGGIGTKSDTPTKFRVMARLDETHVRVLIL